MGGRSIVRSTTMTTHTVNGKTRGCCYCCEPGEEEEEEEEELDEEEVMLQGVMSMG